MNNQQSYETSMTTGLVRGSFVKVMEGELDPKTGKTKYSIQLLIPKTDTKTIQNVRRCIEQAKLKKWGGNPPRHLSSILRDGDIPGPEGIGGMQHAAPGDEVYGGHYFINASNTRKPVVVDQNKHSIIDSSLIKSGDFFHAAIEFFGYQNEKVGVSCSIQGVQFVKEGEALGSVFDADAAFDKLPNQGVSDDEMGFLGGAGQ